MEEPKEARRESVGTDDRRQHDRIAGTFDGRRVGALETPVRIYDLSEGGCSINSTHEPRPGISFHLDIDLPYEGWVRFRAETLYHKPEFGYAVRFVDLTPETSSRLERALRQLRGQAPYDI